LRHKPVLVSEVLLGLNLKPGAVVVDGTLGSGGHSLAILNAIGPKGRLIGLDQDPAALERSRERLEEHQSQISLHHENYVNLDRVLGSLNISKVDAVLLDIGFSSDQMEDASRGFSLERSGPLDMRMNPELEITARDLVQKLSERELADIFWHYGEERMSRRFAKAICERRTLHPLETTQDLYQTLETALPFKIKKTEHSRGYKSKIHPFTKVFQALRIAVNQELEVLRQGLPRIWNILSPGGRFAVISFHSLEDRIVKHQFRAWVDGGEATAVTKKPIIAAEEEMAENPRSRSAKLRVVEKGVRALAETPYKRRAA
jgi:16S rRNA (cytosine1402-N4)-methyltransferase